MGTCSPRAMIIIGDNFGFLGPISARKSLIIRVNFNTDTSHWTNERERVKVASVSFPQATTNKLSLAVFYNTPISFNKEPSVHS